MNKVVENREDLQDLAESDLPAAEIAEAILEAAEAED
jgi:hypothetical protein